MPCEGLHGGKPELEAIQVVLWNLFKWLIHSFILEGVYIIAI